LIAAPVLTIVLGLSDATSAVRPVLATMVAIVPPALSAIALAAVYRVVPATRPAWRAISLPALCGAGAVIVLTRVFIFVGPRIFGANLVYGTLGALLIGLTWLDLVFTVVLLGAAWVRERASVAEAAVV